MSEFVDFANRWLPQLPANWQVAPAWYLFLEGQELFKDNDPHLVPSRILGVVTREHYMERTGLRTVSNEVAAHSMKHVDPDDFIISMSSFESGIEHSPIAGKVSNDYRVLKPTRHALPGYFRWFLKSEPLIDGLRGLTNEIRVGQRIHYSKFSTLKLPRPPLEAQRRIADYLDRETGRIDAMIGKLEELSETLLLRQSRIVVSAIVSSSKHMKWVKVKYVARIQTGTGDTQDASDDGSYSFYVRSQTPLRHTSWEFEGPAILTAGDGAGVGKVFHLVKGKFMAHQRVYVINDFTRVLPEYFFHTFKHFFPVEVVDGTAKSTVESIRMRMIADLKIPLPPLDEQRRIADYLDETTAKIDAMLDKVAQLKDLLTERRAALITAVVTGRKDIA